MRRRHRRLRPLSQCQSASRPNTLSRDRRRPRRTHCRVRTRQGRPASARARSLAPHRRHLAHPTLGRNPHRHRRPSVFHEERRCAAPLGGNDGRAHAQSPPPFPHFLPQQILPIPPPNPEHSRQPRPRREQEAVSSGDRVEWASLRAGRVGADGASPSSWISTGAQRRKNSFANSDKNEHF